MSFAHVRIRLPSGAVVTVAPGGIVGRAPTAAARIPDPRVSEAHALLSLRGQELQLVALRGRLVLEGVEEDEVPLAVGQEIALAEGVSIAVVRVELPQEVLALQLPDQAPRELCAAVYSVLGGPPMDLVPRLIPGAPLWIWSTGEDWCASAAGQTAETLKPGRTWSLDQGVVRCVGISLAEASVAATQGKREGLTILARYDTVHVHRPQRAPVVITGLPARILAEVAAIEVPAPWTAVAREVWPHEERLDNLRALWDRTMRRLRIRLREAGIREDLVRPDGCGNTEIFLKPGDVVRVQAD